MFECLIHLCFKRDFPSTTQRAMCAMKRWAAFGALWKVVNNSITWTLLHFRKAWLATREAMIWREKGVKTERPYQIYRDEDSCADSWFGDVIPGNRSKTTGKKWNRKSHSKCALLSRLSPCATLTQCYRMPSELLGSFPKGTLIPLDF